MNCSICNLPTGNIVGSVLPQCKCGWQAPNPPATQRPWVELTDDEIKPIIQKVMTYYGYKPEHSTLTSGAGFYALARAVLAKSKEKNNG